MEDIGINIFSSLLKILMRDVSKLILFFKPHNRQSVNLGLFRVGMDLFLLLLRCFKKGINYSGMPSSY